MNDGPFAHVYRANPHVSIPRAAIEDDRLSWEARALLIYILTRPDGQVPSARALRDLGGAAKDKTTRIYNELRETGWIRAERVQGPGGRFEWVRRVFDCPQPLTGQPNPDEPVLVQPDAAQPVPVPNGYAVPERDLDWWRFQVNKFCGRHGLDAARAIAEINVDDETDAWIEFVPDNGHKMGWRSWMLRSLERWRANPPRKPSGRLSSQPRGVQGPAKTGPSPLQQIRERERLVAAERRNGRVGP